MRLYTEHLKATITNCSTLDTASMRVLIVQLVLLSIPKSRMSWKPTTRVLGS